MIILLIIIGIIFAINLLNLIFPIKCPKCKRKCNERYHYPGCSDSLYYQCSEHGNINNLKN
jgi:hypothetical protein